MNNTLVKTSATLFGIGYLPYCPGTWASLVGVGVYAALGSYRLLFGILAFVSLLIGFLVSTKAEVLFKKKDPHCVVIDEFAAMTLLLLFVPRTGLAILCAFVLFRLFDIIKPFPIKKIEHFSGSWGIIGDDLVAAVYSFMCISLIQYVL